MTRVQKSTIAVTALLMLGASPILSAKEYKSVEGNPKTLGFKVKKTHHKKCKATDQACLDAKAAKAAEATPEASPTPAAQ